MGRYDRKKFASPRKERTSCVDRGGSAILMACVLSLPGNTPFSVRMWPRYATLLAPNSHFWSLILSL